MGMITCMLTAFRRYCYGDLKKLFIGLSVFQNPKIIQVLDLKINVSFSYCIMFIFTTQNN